MSLQAYMTINKNNISKGASTASSIGAVASTSSTHNDQITVIAFNAGCTIPLDPNSGVATGTRHLHAGDLHQVIRRLFAAAVERARHQPRHRSSRLRLFPPGPDRVARPKTSSATPGRR